MAKVQYYTALRKKNIEAVKTYLHPEIQFIDPQEKVLGREAVLKAAKGFTAIFKTLTIRGKKRQLYRDHMRLDPNVG